jgi:DNA mismatch repair protein MutL
MNRIRVLSEALASQIAAGEVVERPASVVKELVENSLDAGASTIMILIEKSGKERIRVADDGCGMSAEDARLALERHATSKLESAADLARVSTLGFRGEALPSIASVSRFTLTTRDEASAAGCEIVVEGGKERHFARIGCPRGTVVEVRRLFFNLPARRKFLRSDVTEAAHIAALVSQLAAAHPGVRFRLEHGARTVLDAAPVGSREERLYQIERDWVEAAIRVDEPLGGLRLSGWLTPPAAERGSSNRLHFFVNRRPVKDRILAHAVLEAYRQVSSKSGTPRAYLFLELPPEKVDVNVHPAKTEVRFVDQAFVHQAVFSALRNTLGGERRAPEVLVPAALPAERAAASGLAGEPLPTYAGGLEMAATVWGESAPARPRAFVEFAREPPAVLGQFRASFIIAVDADSMWLVDQHAAHERILYEELLERGNRARPEQQLLLSAATVELGPAERVTLEEELPRLASLGFDLESFGPAALLIRAVPAPLSGLDPVRLVKAALAEPEEECRASASAEVEKRLAARVACHAAVKIHTPLGPEKMRFLLHRLWMAAQPTVCPHGRPTTLRIGREQVEGTFGRI